MAAARETARIVGSDAQGAGRPGLGRNAIALP